jgi:hypothetical protein
MNGSRIDGNAAGLAATIRNGPQGSRAAVWHTFGRELQVTKFDEILKARGYTNDTIDWAFADQGGNMYGGVPIDQDGDRMTMFGATGAIENMRTYLNAMAGMRKALFVLSAHGTTERRVAERRENPQPDMPGQGRTYTPGSGMNMTLDPMDEVFRRGFFEGFRTDDPMLEAFAGDRPMFMLNTIFEDYSGPLTVLCDGVNIGSISMLGLSSGSSYRLELTDLAWDALYQVGALDDDLLSFTFNFPSGSFQVSTEWDQQIFDLTHYGIGLMGPGIIEVPTPHAGMIIGAASIGLMSRRRRKNA